MARTPEDEFTQQFRKAATDLERIKLAVRDGRYTIWSRRDKPNFPEEYLSPIPSLPEKHPVGRALRKTGGEGMNYVLELKYQYRAAGKVLPVYLKGYFSKSGHLILSFEIQSLRNDD